MVFVVAPGAKDIGKLVVLLVFTSEVWPAECVYTSTHVGPAVWGENLSLIYTGILLI